MANLQELRYFLTVAKTANVSRAAELCGISQPVLSQALRRLEDSVGTRLFLREKTGVRLTRAGQRFAEQSQDLVRQWERLTHSARASETELAARFRFGVHTSVAVYALPKFLPTLQSTHPDVHLELTHALSREIAADVIAWRLDFGLVINPPRHADLVIRELATDEVTLWVRSPARHTDTLLLEASLLQTQALLKQLARRGFKFKHHLQSSSLEVLCALTAGGVGVGMLPSRVADTSPHKLKRFDARAPVHKDKLCLIYRAGTQAQSAARALIDVIAAAGI